MWQIKGLGILSHLSGEYSEEELRGILTLALESSPDIFYFDNYLEGRDERGQLLSGSQLLSLFEGIS